jgi:hypothetical protein
MGQSVDSGRADIHENSERACKGQSTTGGQDVQTHHISQQQNIEKRKVIIV